MAQDKSKERYKPKPEHLGTGGAAKAAKKLKTRKEQLDELERESLKGTKKGR